MRYGLSVPVSLALNVDLFLPEIKKFWFSFTRNSLGKKKHTVFSKDVFSIDKRHLENRNILN